MKAWYRHECPRLQALLARLETPTYDGYQRVANAFHAFETAKKLVVQDVFIEDSRGRPWHCKRWAGRLLREAMAVVR